MSGTCRSTRGRSGSTSGSEGSRRGSTTSATTTTTLTPGGSRSGRCTRSTASRSSGLRCAQEPQLYPQAGAGGLRGVRRPGALAARAAEHDVVAGDGVPRPPLDLVQHALELVVGERLDLAAI